MWLIRWPSAWPVEKPQYKQWLLRKAWRLSLDFEMLPNRLNVAQKAYYVQHWTHKNDFLVQMMADKHWMSVQVVCEFPGSHWPSSASELLVVTVQCHSRWHFVSCLAPVGLELLIMIHYLFHLAQRTAGPVDNEQSDLKGRGYLIRRNFLHLLVSQVNPSFWTFRCVSPVE